MTDRGMIVKWFEFCRVKDKCSTDCPYWNNNGSARECTKKLAKDVLALLKEHEEVYPSWQNGKMYCGQCGSKFPPRVGMRFCHRCGTPIKLKVNDIVEQEGR